ncbi:DUF1540 domain-containing protein [Risungbinella massiliensis]|uniref:DUF1540 domain-containing protein n=1 Tax=Risungbinella massiliensis TaxID=1329796 RepID=UPI0005CC56E1|nr:DUF1540 domain-containing protein [Risungbinella massiliensis]
MPRRVLCEVNNCTYWGKGNLCQADEIFVVSHRGSRARDSHETDCNTFKPNSITTPDADLM